MLKLGPKEMKGEAWDEKGRVGIAEIQISHQQDLINSIRFTYYQNDKLSRSEIYGEFNGLMFDSVQFAENESLIGISGRYKDGRLASIEFGTNRRVYGPFGRIKSKSNKSKNKSESSSSSSSYEKFKYVFKPRRFGGFHGSVDDGCVSAIGVYIKPYRRDDDLPVVDYDEDLYDSFWL